MAKFLSNIILLREAGSAYLGAIANTVRRSAVFCMCACFFVILRLDF